MPHDERVLSQEDRVRLGHMLESARRVLRYCDGYTKDMLAADEMRLLAVVKSIEIIGEASTKVSASSRDRVMGLDWRGMKLIRNRLIHGYDSIDVSRVMDTVEIDIRPLTAALEAALEA